MSAGAGSRRPAWPARRPAPRRPASGGCRARTPCRPAGRSSRRPGRAQPPGRPALPGTCRQTPRRRKARQRDPPRARLPGMAGQGQERRAETGHPMSPVRNGPPRWAGRNDHEQDGEQRPARPSNRRRASRQPAEGRHGIDDPQRAHPLEELETAGNGVRWRPHGQVPRRRVAGGQHGPQQPFVQMVQRQGVAVVEERIVVPQVSAPQELFQGRTCFGSSGW